MWIVAPRLVRFGHNDGLFHLADVYPGFAIHVFCSEIEEGTTVIGVHGIDVPVLSPMWFDLSNLCPLPELVGILVRQGWDQDRKERG
jgi:hypothetical protein